MLTRLQGIKNSNVLTVNWSLAFPEKPSETNTNTSANVSSNYEFHCWVARKSLYDDENVAKTFNILEPSMIATVFGTK